MTDDNQLDDAGTDDDKPIQLPADHPLVKSLAAMKEQIKDLKTKAAENADKASKFDELEEANRTELEKVQARADAAEKRLQERDAKDEAAKVRDEVAKAKGVPASALRGSSKEDFEEHADELIAAGIKPAVAPSSDGQGDTGEQVSETDEKSADEIVNAAVGG